MDENKEFKILQYIKGELDAQSCASLEEWIQESAAHEAEVLQIARLYYADKTHRNIQKREVKAKQSFIRLQKRIRQKRLVHLFQRVGQLAAMLGGVFLLSYLLLQFETIRDKFIQPQEIVMQANKGMQSQMTLPDGTKVWLNSGSKLSYSIPFGRDERRVQVSGLAYFEVEKDPLRAFVVDVNETLDIHVLGTKFNVQAYADEPQTKIALTEGSILITNVAGTDIECKMQEQDEFVYDASTQTYQVKSNPDISNYIAWIHNEFIFKDTPMADVFKQLSHHFNVEIIIKDKLIEQYRFTGKFRNKRLHHILEYIKATSPLRIQEENLQINTDSYLEQEKIYIYTN